VLGTAKTRQQTNPPDHARDLAEIALEDQDGREVRLGDLWRERPAVLVLLRHYGCLYCRHYAVQLHKARKAFDMTDVELAAIGQGTPAHARDFQRMQGIDIPLLVDGDRRVYEAAGAKVATLAELYRPGLLLDAGRKALGSRLRRGSIVVSPGPVMNHPAQLGGVLIVAPDGSVRYAYMSEDAGDNPPCREVLAAARAIRPHSRSHELRLAAAG
jgi:peroxiredoxin